MLILIMILMVLIIVLDAVVADDAPDAEEGTDAVADSVDAVVDSDRGACHNWTAPFSARS
jgi:biopolymer transport protein ExbD